MGPACLQVESNAVWILLKGFQSACAVPNVEQQHLGLLTSLLRGRAVRIGPCGICIFWHEWETDTV